MSRLTQRLAPPLCGRSLSIGTAKERALSLEGQVAWVVGGVGIVGAGICRGLLRAGATVLVNSRHETRLEQLADELGHPEQLVCVTGSMLPEHAAATITAGLDRTSQQLDHVVAHCAVRWWARNHGDETSTVLRNANSLLSIAPEEFPALASQLASLHFAAAHHLVPRLSQERSSYTFMTGGGPSQMRSVPGTLSSLGHVNAAVVSGLAGAMRSELSGSSLRVSELRVSMRLNRPASERKLDPRETPLSHQLGAVCAGIAADARGGGKDGNLLHEVCTDADVKALRERYPVADVGYSVYFNPGLL